MEHKRTVILYHAKCPDGFGGAYAAWKKYGDAAEYIPVKHGSPIPEHMNGREITLVDFCYPQEGMDQLKKLAASIVVLDHHEGVRDVATQFPGVFDTSRSGATIAWNYFHPDEPVPKLLSYLEDGDLYRYALPETRDIFSYLEVYPRELAAWEELASALEDDAKRQAVLDRAGIYTEYFERLGDEAAAGAKLVSFEGFECYFANSHPSTTMKSYVAHALYEKQPPISMVVTAHPEGFGVSIRSDGSVDVAAIARKYGGNGHPGAAGFFIPVPGPIPWTQIDVHENSGH